MYKSFIRPILFLIDAERVHHIVFSFLKTVSAAPGIKTLLHACFVYEHPSLTKEILGLTFKNPIGLAAGFDKNAMLIDELTCLGFGFVEIGTVTPKPQPGNDKPRLFRLPKDAALINRMGFNNDGVHLVAERLRRKRSSIIIGGNIGKNKITPNEQALDDYVASFHVLYDVVDYFVVNVSSPNTPGLRELQEREPLKKLLSHIKSLSLAKPKPKPVLLKIAPDLTNEQLNDIVDILQETKTDGIIATNTTVSRDALHTDKTVVDAIGNGGLSGRPLTSRATDVIRYLRQKLGKDFPIIGVGGIMTEQDAQEKLDAGADLIQIYTGFIYEGPGFAKRIAKKFVESFKFKVSG